MKNKKNMKRGRVLFPILILGYVKVGNATRGGVCKVAKQNTGKDQFKYDNLHYANEKEVVIFVDL